MSNRFNTLSPANVSTSVTIEFLADVLDVLLVKRGSCCFLGVIKISLLSFLFLYYMVEFKKFGLLFLEAPHFIRGDLQLYNSLKCLAR